MTTTPREPTAPPVSARIGDWHLDVRCNELRRGAESVRLEPKAIEVLAFLAARPGEVIGREEMLAAVWPGVIVGDDVLTQAIIKLRKALGDDAQSPRYIETIPKRGYRLIAPVRKADMAPDAAAAPPSPEAGVSAARPAGRGRPPWSALAAIVAAAVVLFLFQRPNLPWPLGTESQESSPAGSYPFVAVLPLANLSGDPARDYLSEGLTAELITAIGRFPGVRVMSWNAVQPFKGEGASPSAVYRALAARYVLRGSVRMDGQTIRVSVELSDAQKGLLLWSEGFDGQGTQLLEIQDRIAKRIAGALAVRLQDIEQRRAVARSLESAEAYDLLLRARALMRLETRKTNREARELLARAQELAPGYAELWVALGEAEWARAAYGWIEDPAEGVRRAEAHARRALESPDAGEGAAAHSLLATLRTHTGRAEEGLAHASRAVSMNPSDVSAIFRRAHALLVLGRAEESVAAYEYAMRLEPRPGLGPQSQMATALYMAGRYRETVTYADVSLAQRNDFAAMHAIRAAALVQLGESGKAREAAANALRLNPTLKLGQVGTRFERPEDAAKLRDGLAKAGL